MSTVRITNGLQIHYREHGTGDQVLVLIHGNTASSLWWEPFMAHLPGGYRAVAPDLRGCGDSDKPDGPWTITDLGHDIHQFTQALGLSRYTVVGHSLGGAVAMALTVGHPEAVGRLVLINSGPAEGLHLPEGVFPQLELIAKAPDYLKAGLAACMPSAPKDEFYARLLDDSVAKSAGAYVRHSRAVSDMDLSQAVTAITAPTLIIYGTLNDPIVTLPMMERTRALIPGALLECWDGVGHSAPVEVPERLAQRVAAFVEAGRP